MKKIAIVQSSLREGGNTSIVCREFEKKALDAELEVTYVDLKDVEMELCDGRDFWGYSQDLQDAYKEIESVEAIIFGMPVYQYSMSGVLKNFIDICGGAMEGKAVWAIVNAGWPNCYMASRDLLDCLYYEYQTTSIAPTPYTWSMDFKDWKLVNKKVEEKLDQLVEKILVL